MKQFSAEQIQERFEQLPKDLQEAISSPEINTAIQAIGDKHSLHIDQLGELVDLIGLVMLGLIPSKEFVKNLSNQANIRESVSAEIADDVNKEIFSKIKSAMQSLEEKFEQDKDLTDPTYTSSISDLEKIGNFTIEEPQKEGAEEKTESLKTMSDETATSTHREALLDALENPEPTPQPIAPARVDVHTEPLVDLLMNKPTSIPEEKVVKVVGAPTKETPKATPPAPKVAPGPDPYREAIE
ncbi:MAG: hypothetical protein AAB381_01490 [Patescibacteria group bacterium]